jgi:hypothetical protein
MVKRKDFATAEGAKAAWVFVRKKKSALREGALGNAG